MQYDFLLLLTIITLATALPQTKNDSNDGIVEPAKFAPKFIHPSYLFHEHNMIPAGTSLRLFCAADGNPSPNITWTKNGGPIERSYFRPSYGRWWILLEELSRTDNGNYTCLVCNELGCISHTVSLQVQERLFSKPVLIRGPRNLTLSLGETARFDCDFQSDLHHIVTWNFYSEERNNILSDDPTDKPEQLTIANITKEDEGLYTCVALNTLGSESASGYLTVLDRKKDEEDYVKRLVQMITNVVFYIATFATS